VPGDHPGAVALAPTLGEPGLDGHSSAEGLWSADPASSSIGVDSFPLKAPTTVYALAHQRQKPEPQSRAELSLTQRVVVRHSALKLTIRCQGSIACQGQASQGILRHLQVSTHTLLTSSARQRVPWLHTLSRVSHVRSSCDSVKCAACLGERRLPKLGE
jgi:hypothetical protein